MKKPRPTNDDDAEALAAVAEEEAAPEQSEISSETVDEQTAADEFVTVPVAEPPSVESPSPAEPPATMPETSIPAAVEGSDLADVSRIVGSAPATQTEPVIEPAVSSTPVESEQEPEPQPAEEPTAPAEVVTQQEIGVPEEAVTEEQAPVSGFRRLNLREEVLKAVESRGYTEPTEIQAQIIPHVLEGRDVLAQSQTGTGKTAAFALPVLSEIDTTAAKPQALVLAPTRELAMQVAESFEDYGREISRARVLAIYGGSAYGPQISQLKRGVAVVVGTPGRVIDHIKKGTLDLSDLKCLVLDEADEMLNMGFLEDVQFVLQHTPPTRQVALFSATLPPAIRKIAEDYLNDPVRITVKRKTMTAEAIRQRAVICQHRDKLDVLSRFLEVEETDGVIIFTKTREATVTVAEHLVREGFSAVALNGDMPQNVRERTIDQLKSNRLDIVVATDVAARGLDVSRISHVFNFDVPQDTESYIHRIGRTGRAGRDGEAIILLSNSQRYKLRHIERLTKQPIEVVTPPTADDINTSRVSKFKEQIAETAAKKDLTLYTQILTELAAESELSAETIAAALAHISHKGRRFFVEDRPKRERRDRDRDDRRNSRDDRGERNQRYEDRGDRKPRDSRRAGRIEAGMDRYRIEVGHDDGVRPGNIVGAIANEAGIEGQYIGPINIYDGYSTIDLPAGMPPDVFNTLQDVRVAGKQLRLRRATESDNHGESSFRKGPRRNGGGSRHGGSRNFGGKRFGGKGGGHKGKRKSFGKRRSD